ncbi:S41 family peptidase [Olivibacter sitiensis]|uniref:S41 family peptidase n=1 Tax=Olivibacter sitiensis TaxID=376470 RepID=UPI00041DCB0D|nr:S41 family peptidase [Olivibacter sitiensis]
MKWSGLLIAFLCVTIFAACDKEELVNDPYADVPASGTRIEKSLDSIFLYAYETYLWNDALPSYSTFNPRNFKGADSEELPILNRELYALSQVAMNQQTSAPYESALYAGFPKYSSIQPLIASITSGSSIDATRNDLGLVLASSGRKIYVQQVLPGSPAERAGLARGQEVLSINGQTAAASTTLDQSALVLTVKQANGSEKTYALTSADYQSSALYKYKTLNKKASGVGYMALGPFSRLAQVQPELDTAFAKFAKEKINTLVIDLRYSDAGYIETAEYLANLIAPSSINTQLMYAKQFNSQMQEGRASILKNQPYYDANGDLTYLDGRIATLYDVDYSLSGNRVLFDKKGELETVKQVYFVVGGNTSSTGEMLINILKPYVDVTLVGSDTYGSPVGSLAINIDQYTLYLSNFQVKNANGEGDYFMGMKADLAASDDVSHDWGDPEEECLATILASLGVSSETQVKRLFARQQQHNGVLTLKTKEDNEKGFAAFVGAIENRLKLK